MRIAGNTMRRNYLSRYERNYSDKYDSEKKIYSGRQFDRASESPIAAAKALRIRKTMSEIETYQDNLKTADSIYTNAESSMLTVSSIIQNVYEKLVEGAHGTRNQDDLEILAMEVENHAEEMVQSFNIDIADRKVFGGLNNDTPAFKIERSYSGEKYLTYNGIDINSSNDPHSFPYDGTSYLDIGIGMTTDSDNKRIDDQSALPITFNGAECTGCGMTSKTAAIDYSSLIPGNEYKIDVTAAGKKRTISFIASADDKVTTAAINEELKAAFKETPEIQDDGSFEYIDNPKITPYGAIEPNNNRLMLGDIETGKYYSVTVKTEDKQRVINFLGDASEPLANLDKALRAEFGENAVASSDGVGISITVNNKDTVLKTVDETMPTVPLTADGKLDFDSLTPGTTYAMSVDGTKINEDGEVIPVGPQKVYFTAAQKDDGTLDKEATIYNINTYIDKNELFGEPKYPTITETGTLAYPEEGKSIIIDNAYDATNKLEYSSIDGYPKNLIQLVLDSAKLLRKGDQDMVARYADLLYAAQSNLSIAIADLGTHSKFIEFNEDRLADVMINLQSKQNDIESTDLPSEITQWKVLESVYNASLQMGSKVLSQSIFNYIS